MQTDGTEIDEVEFCRGRLEEARLGFVTELRETDWSAANPNPDQTSRQTRLFTPVFSQRKFF